MEIENQRMYKSAGRYSVPKKKKKVSYFHELSQQHLPKPPKPTLKATWQNPQGQPCKKILPPNRCFCTHPYSHHESPKTIGPTFCQVPGCRCKCYQYVPFYDLKCMCRHSYKEHDPVSRMCRMCARCLGFLSNWGCRCGRGFQVHQTVFQVVRERDNGGQGERESRGKDSKLLNSQRINSRNEADFSLQPDESDKENLKTASLLFPKPDARSYQLSKYTPQLKQYLQNESKLEQHKRKQIERINSKYGNNNYERQVEVQERNQMMGMGSRICRPQLARSVTPLELIIRPHLYNNVRLEEFLEMEMRRCQGKSIDGGRGL